MEDDGRQKSGKMWGKKLFLKVARDRLGTLVGVPIAQKKLNPTEVTTFFDQFFFVRNLTVWLPIDSHESN